jgi:hypothetical protein
VAYVITKAIDDCRIYATQISYPEGKQCFVSAVEILHLLTQGYTMLDKGYQDSVAELLYWRKAQYEEVIPGKNTLTIDVPVLHTEYWEQDEVIDGQSTSEQSDTVMEVDVGDNQLQVIKKSQYKQGLQLFFTGEERQMTVLDLEVLFSKLHLTLLMKVIAKRTQTFDAQDEMSE